VSGEAGFARAFPEVAREENAHGLKERFRWHDVGEHQLHLMEQVRMQAATFAQELNAYVPASDELRRAIDHIEAALFLANAAIARHWHE
jgi:hypothetical protein